MQCHDHGKIMVSLVKYMNSRAKANIVSGRHNRVLASLLMKIHYLGNVLWNTISHGKLFRNLRGLPWLRILSSNTRREKGKRQKKKQKMEQRKKRKEKTEKKEKKDKKFKYKFQEILR